MSENGRKRSLPADCVAPQTEMWVRVTDKTEVGLEEPARMDRVVLHLGGLDSTNDVVLHMTADELLRLYVAFGQALAQVVPLERALSMIAEASNQSHLWRVDDVSRRFNRIPGRAS